MNRFGRGIFVTCALACGASCHRHPEPPPPPKQIAIPAGRAVVATAPPLVEPEVEEEPSAVPGNSPVSLTASDGTGLTIESYEARAVVQDPLAFTELHLIFRNPQARQIEGQFEITLPPSATLSRFATKQEWGWQEGEVVEKQAARVAYEDFLHRRQDPALLEKQPGNQFHARVFPIPPSGKKEIILSYSEELPRTGVPYRVHLRGLPVVDKLDVTASVSRHKQGDVTTWQTESMSLHRSHVQPDADFTVPIPAIAQQPQSGLRSGEATVARVRPVATEATDAVKGLYVLFDTSASRALDFEAQIAKLAATLGELGNTGAASAPLKVVCFDQELETVYEGTIAGFDQAAQDKIRARRALGASDLGAALAAVAKEPAQRYGRLLLVTDGIATAGATEAAPLGKRMKALADAGIERADAIVAGGIRDANRLSQLVTAGLARDGVVLDAGKPAASLARRLGRATVSHLKVTVPGAKWSWPAELNGVQPGDEVLIYAALPAQTSMTVNLDGPAGADGAATHYSYPVPLTSVERPLLERALVAAELHKLDAERNAAKGAEVAELSKRIVAMSTKYRVLCDDTALLVLETEDDYARFGIDRRALSDILTVGKEGGIEVMHRAGQKLAQAPKKDPEWLKNADTKRQKAEDKAKESGVLGVTRNGDGSHVASVFGRDAAFGNEGGVVGGQAAGVAVVHEAHGAAGLSLRGSGSGGGGTGEGTIGLGTLGTIGHGAGVATGTGQGFGRGEGRMGRLQGHDESGATTATPPPAPARRAPPADRLDDALSATEDTREAHIVARPEPRPGPAAAAEQQRPEVNPYDGKLKDVMTLVGKHQLAAAQKKAEAWRKAEPGDVLALIALGEVAEKKGDRHTAARAYGSIIDLFPGRADLRRFAGERLERVGDAARTLAVDTYKKARDQRPDHPASHRLLAYAQLRMGDVQAAFDTIVAGAKRDYPDGRFLGVDRILKEDAGLIGAVLIKRHAKAKAGVEAKLAKLGASLPAGRSLRFVLVWETDANDVDFHIHDGRGGHAYYQHKDLASGGSLYADVTTGYGPECFTIEGEPAAYPYKLQAHYYSRGPMGYGMGKLEIIEHDGAGNLKFEERPFVIMQDNAFVDLGRVEAPMHASR